MVNGKRPRKSGPAPQDHDSWGDNATRSVHVVIKSVLQEPRCLIVIGSQDLLSFQTIVLDAVNLKDGRR